MNNGNNQNIGTFNPVMLDLRKIGNSTTLAVAIISQIVNVVLGVLMGIAGGWMLMTLIYSLPELMSLMGYYVSAEHYEVFMVLETVALFFPMLGGIVSLACSVFPIIKISSYCVIRANVKNDSKPLKTGALNTLLVVAIINLVFCCIGLLWRLVKSVLSMLSQMIAGVASMGAMQEGLAALGIGFEVIVFVEMCTLFVSTIISVISIVFYCKYIKTVNSVKNVIKTGKIKKLPSRFVGVMGYISAVFNLLYALVIVIMLIPGGALFNNMTPREASFGVFAVMLLLYFISGAVAQTGGAVIVFKIRELFEEIKNYESAPVVISAEEVPEKATPVEAEVVETVAPDEKAETTEEEGAKDKDIPTDAPDEDTPETADSDSEE